MQQLFATRFQIANDDPEAARRSILSDVAQWAWREEDPAPDLLAEPRGEASKAGYSLSWQTLEPDAYPDAVTRVLLSHPDEQHAGIEWVTAVDVVRAEAWLRVSIQIQRHASQMRIAPAALDLHRPRLVPALIAHHECSCGDGIALSPIERTLPPADIDAFVREVLTLPERALPVIVLTVPSGGRYPATNARYLSDALAGLAHVFVLSGHLSWERLRDALGNGRLVPRGGARLFWPGLGGDADSLRHPYWGRAGLRHRPARRSFARHLFSILAPLSVLRVPPDPAIPAIRRAYSESRRAELAERSAEEAVGAALDDLEQVDELQRQIEELRAELEEKNAIILRHEENWRQLHTPPADPRLGAEGDDTAEAEAARVESWEEAAELAEILADSEAFFLTEKAARQIAACDYPDPGRMFADLERLSDAAEAYRVAEGELGQRFDQWALTHFGIEVSLHDAGLVEASRDTFEFEGENYSREPHVKVDDYVDPARCGRIYFALDSTNKRIIVDHVGLHL